MIKQIRPNLFHLRVFQKVYETRSITKTAELLGRSQPAISQALKSLEKTFNTTLFHRSTKGITKTKEAVTLLKRTNRALHSLDTFFDSVISNFTHVPKNVSRHVTTTQLYALQAVAEAGSFIAGAAIANKSSPTIHRAARDLEQTVNITLFERTSFGIRPNKVAMQLAQVAGVIEREFELAFAEIAQNSNIEKGNTVIGALPMARSYIIPKAIVEFKKECPHHNVSIVEGPYEYLLHDLMRGKIDILIGASRRLHRGTALKQTPIITEPIILLMRTGHPLKTKDIVEIRELLLFPWITPRISAPLREVYKELFINNNLPLPENVIESNSLSASRVILQNSDTLMLLSKAQAKHELKTGSMISKKIRGFDAQRTIDLQIRQESMLTKTQLNLIENIKQIAKSESNILP
jgi:LysR family transcriptional regulator of gallate degradation|tara:strand:- start:7702 stop:8922 length:1221 start_codon:yes stop_codon:yes gene_type:complete